MAEAADVTEQGDRREIADEGDWRTRGETEMTKNGDKQERDGTEITKNGDREKERGEKEKAKEEERREMTTNGDRERESEEKEMASEGESKETTEDEKCGIGTCHPQVMQRFARLIFFTLSLSFSGFCSLLTGPLLVSQVMYATHTYVCCLFLFLFLFRLSEIIIMDHSCKALFSNTT